MQDLLMKIWGVIPLSEGLYQFFAKKGAQDNLCRQRIIFLKGGQFLLL